MNIFDEFRARWYDLIHNVDTHSKVRLTNLEVVGTNKASGSMYFPTLPGSMAAVLASLGGIDPSTTFIDIGCGKGLTLLIAARHPFRKIMGVEFSPALHRIAEENIRRYRGSRQCTNSEVLCMDAADFRFPPGPLLIYFFNPFAKPVMEKVLSNLAASARNDARELTLICDKLHDRDLIERYLRPRKTVAILGFSTYSALDPSPTPYSVT